MVVTRDPRASLEEVEAVVDPLDAVVGDPAVVDLLEARSSLEEVEAVGDPPDAAVGDPVGAVAVPRATPSSSAPEEAVVGTASPRSRNVPLSWGGRVAEKATLIPQWDEHPPPSTPSQPGISQHCRRLACGSFQLLLSIFPASFQREKKKAES